MKKIGNSIQYKSEYRLILWDVQYDYSGSEWILGTHTDTNGKIVENSLAKKWLNEYFNWGEASNYPNRTSTNINIKKVAYLMDTNVWGDMYKG